MRPTHESVCCCNLGSHPVYARRPPPPTVPHAASVAHTKSTHHGTSLGRGGPPAPASTRMQPQLIMLQCNGGRLFPGRQGLTCGGPCVVAWNTPSPQHDHSLCKRSARRGVACWCLSLLSPRVCTLAQQAQVDLLGLKAHQRPGPYKLRCHTPAGDVSRCCWRQRQCTPDRRRKWVTVVWMAAVDHLLALHAPAVPPVRDNRPPCTRGRPVCEGPHVSTHGRRQGMWATMPLFSQSRVTSPSMETEVVQSWQRYPYLSLSCRRCGSASPLLAALHWYRPSAMMWQRTHRAT